MQLAITWTEKKRTFAPLVLTGNIQDCFRNASELGYHGVEMSISSENDIPVQTVKESIKRYGLIVSAIGTGLALAEDGLSFSNHDERIRKAAEARFKKQITFAGELEAPVILGLIHGKLSTNNNSCQEREWIRDITYSSALYARELGVNIIIEPINRYETNFINTMAEALNFINEIKLSNVGVMGDTFHMNIEEKDMVDSISSVAGKLIYFHLADSNRMHPGSGHVDFKVIINELHKIQYKGFLSIECLPLPTPIVAAKEAITFIKNILN